MKGIWESWIEAIFKWLKSKFARDWSFRPQMSRDYEIGFKLECSDLGKSSCGAPGSERLRVNTAGLIQTKGLLDWKPIFLQ